MQQVWKLIYDVTELQLGKVSPFFSTCAEATLPIWLGIIFGLRVLPLNRSEMFFGLLHFNSATAVNSALQWTRQRRSGTY